MTRLGSLGEVERETGPGTRAKIKLIEEEMDEFDRRLALIIRNNVVQPPIVTSQPGIDGTPNYLAKFALGMGGNIKLVDSIVIEVSGLVGVGTVTPANKIDVVSHSDGATGASPYGILVTHSAASTGPTSPDNTYAAMRLTSTASGAPALVDRVAGVRGEVVSAGGTYGSGLFGFDGTFTITSGSVPNATLAFAGGHFGGTVNMNISGAATKPRYLCSLLANRLEMTGGTYDITSTIGAGLVALAPEPSTGTAQANRWAGVFSESDTQSTTNLGGGNVLIDGRLVVAAAGSGNTAATASAIYTMAVTTLDTKVLFQPTSTSQKVLVLKGTGSYASNFLEIRDSNNNLGLAVTSNNYIAFKPFAATFFTYIRPAPTQVADIAYTLPNTRASAGANSILLNDGAASDPQALSWSTLAAAGLVTGTGSVNTIAKWISTTGVGNSSVTDDGADLTCQNVNINLKNSDNTSRGMFFYEPSGGGVSIVGIQAPALAGDTFYTWPNAYPTVSGQPLLSTTAGAWSWATAIRETSGNIILGGGASAAELRFLEPSGSGTNYTAIKAGAQSADITLVLPTTAAAGLLKYDGSSASSWLTGTVGQMLYHDGTNWMPLAASTTDTSQFLNSLSLIGDPQPPAWVNLTIGDIQSGTLGTGMGGTGLTTYAQGDMLYYSSGMQRLAKSTTATRYVANTGTSNNPAWAQVNLANGVTGTLPVTNGGTGQASALTQYGVIYGSTTTAMASATGLKVDATNQRIFATYSGLTTEGEGVTWIGDVVALTAQTAAIGATNMTNGAARMLHRVSYYLVTTTADVTAGTIQVSIGYTDVLGATTQVSAALSLAATGRTSGQFFIQRASGNITYATTLVGIMGTAQYALYLTLELLSN